MLLGVPRETFPGERRVAVVPAVLPALAKLGFELRIEAGAGAQAGYPDSLYAEKGAQLVASRTDVWAADCVCQVRLLGANPQAGAADLPLIRPGQVLVGMADPLAAPQAAAELARRGASLWALELLPRITRAQSMDVLSSQATVAGYRAVLLAAVALPKMFPMLNTAAGTITPAKVLVVGAGVAGLQAIACARRLGAVVSAYDVRAEVKEQVQSLGARFVELELDAQQGAGQGGYARSMDEAFYQKQRQLMLRVVAESDVVITTAAVPGKKAPTLITADMVHAMAPGSVLVDLAAERGGNCELTRPGQTVHVGGVTILGPDNLPSDVAYHASAMFARNLANLLAHVYREGKLHLDPQDPITRETLVAHQGQVVQERVRALLESS
jgi:NAD(P) transhydrogenase subunit alpha